MAIALLIQLFDQQRLAFSRTVDGPVELGRQSDLNERTYTCSEEHGRYRLVIATNEEASISRRHVLAEALPNGQIRLTNTSSVNALALQDGSGLNPGAAAVLALPIVVGIGRRLIRFEATDPDTRIVHGLEQATMAPGQYRIGGSRLPGRELPAGGLDVESVLRWLQALLGVLQTAASSSEFFQRSVRAVVEIIGLDEGRFLIIDQDRWTIEAGCRADGANPAADWRPSRLIMGRMIEEKRTLWMEPDQEALESATLVGVSAVVAAPILNAQGEITGVLYGERRGTSMGESPRIMRLDAMLMELLASGVAAGLARLDQEKSALAAQVRFEQFFTPELASELVIRPDLLKSRDVEVSLLFCDIRSFSRISKRLGSSGTMDWIGDVLGALSDCVLRHKGVLVDYIGDELIAMWGAPKEEPAHASLACKAALDILAMLPQLNQRWQAKLEEPLEFCIGINTGGARVGNTGSPRKFKYGALGNTVDLTSRVRGATKYFKSDLIITGSTAAKLDRCFSMRRLCTVEVFNIPEPVELYELVLPERLNWMTLRQGYEAALERFENQEFREAAQILGNLLAEFPDDGPSLLLLSRAVNHLIESPEQFSPVWKLPGK